MSISTHSGFNCPGWFSFVLLLSGPSRPLEQPATVEDPVGQNARHPGCFCMLGAVWLAVTVGVGQPEDEDSFPSVWCADFLRRKQSERAAETASFQVLKDAIEADREMS